MTRILQIETCDAPCPHAVGSRGCRHPRSLWNDEGITRIRPFEDYPLIPAWCPLEQDGPDWMGPGIIKGAPADRGGVLLPEEVPVHPCPRCRVAMAPDRQITFIPRPFPGRAPPPPRPIWLCRTCGMRIDREGVLPGLDFPVCRGTAPGSGPWPRPGQKPARRGRG